MKNLTPCFPHFKATEGRQNRHGSIRYL